MPWTSSLPAASLLLLLLCFPGQNSEEHQQSTDILSVWEGDSITITCSMKASDSEVTTLLTTGIQSVIVCTYKQSNSSVLPALADRAECSKEGRDLRITLHNAQESDSNIYQCIKFIKIRGHHKKLNGKTTIVVVKGYTSGVVEQSPLYANPQQGKSISITCALNNSHEEKGIYLLKTHTQRERVLYVSSQNASSTVFPPFANRLEYSKEEQKIVITLHNLQENDSDIYVCAGVLNGSSFLSVNRRGTMVLIKGVEQTNCSNSCWGIYGLAFMVALLFFVLICCTLYHVDVKKYFKKPSRNAVYEDMSYSSRRNTLVRTNNYIYN